MHRIAATLAIVVALLFGAGAACADFDDGVAAFKRGDSATAFLEWVTSAEQGLALAQYLVAEMYISGEDVSKNEAEAAKWFRKAAEQGHAISQAKLGVMYDLGRGVPENDVEAVKWFRKAAEQGDADGQTGLGFTYATGAGIPVNNVKAYMWLSLAKAQGHETAADNLDIVKKRMTPADISKAQALASKMWEKPNN